MNVTKYFFTLFPLFALTVLGHAAPRREDPRTKAIATPQLQQFVERTPLNSPQHATLISRAYASKIIGTAYNLYTNKWKKQPNDAYANLWRGSAASNYDWYASYPSTKIRLTPEQRSRLFQTALSCLSKAVELKPDLARANAAYGSFIWANRGQEKEGLRLIEKATVLEPKTASHWAALGHVRSNRFRSTYDAAQAEKALRTAAQLDPLYAHPHYIMIRLFLEQKRYKEANDALQTYVSLVPANSAASTIEFFKPQIDKGLQKS